MVDAFVQNNQAKFQIVLSTRMCRVFHIPPSTLSHSHCSLTLKTCTPIHINWKLFHTLVTVLVWWGGCEGVTNGFRAAVSPRQSHRVRGHAAARENSLARSLSARRHHHRKVGNGLTGFSALSLRRQRRRRPGAMIAPREWKGRRRRRRMFNIIYLYI